MRGPLWATLVWRSNVNVPWVSNYSADGFRPFSGTRGGVCLIDKRKRTEVSKFDIEDSGKN